MFPIPTAEPTQASTNPTVLLKFPFYSFVVPLCFLVYHKNDIIFKQVMSMFVEERQNLILEDLQENGKVLVKDLSTRFGVTPDLIRKDLAFLESKGKCKKIYGGAILNRLNVHLEDANSRKSVNSKEKQKIAQMAYDLIEPNMTVFLDISTTNIELAKLLVLRPISGITVVTNMLDVIQILSTSQIHSIFIGGEFDYARNGFVGNMCDEFLQRFHFDLAF